MFALTPLSSSILHSPFSILHSPFSIFHCTPGRDGIDTAVYDAASGMDNAVYDEASGGVRVGMDNALYDGASGTGRVGKDIYDGASDSGMDIYGSDAEVRDFAVPTRIALLAGRFSLQLSSSPCPCRIILGMGVSLLHLYDVLRGRLTLTTVFMKRLKKMAMIRPVSMNMRQLQTMLMMRPVSPNIATNKERCCRVSKLNLTSSLPCFRRPLKFVN